MSQKMGQFRSGSAGLQPASAVVMPALPRNTVAGDKPPRYTCVGRFPRED